MPRMSQLDGSSRLASSVWSYVQLSHASQTTARRRGTVTQSDALSDVGDESLAKTASGMPPLVVLVNPTEPAESWHDVIDY
jgi:hypothetical protein